MRTKLKSQLALLSMVALSSQMCHAELSPHDVDGCEPYKPKTEPPVPKGMKYYMFNASGEFSTDRMRNDELVFTCYAINDKNAVKKFNKRNP